jgi:hypothetical protein
LHRAIGGGTLETAVGNAGVHVYHLALDSCNLLSSAEPRLSRRDTYRIVCPPGQLRLLEMRSIASDGVRAGRIFGVKCWNHARSFRLDQLGPYLSPCCARARASVGSGRPASDDRGWVRVASWSSGGRRRLRDRLWTGYRTGVRVLVMPDGSRTATTTGECRCSRGKQQSCKEGLLQKSATLHDKFLEAQGAPRAYAHRRRR